MPQFNFGSGLLFVTPINGVGPAFSFGTLQDVSVDLMSDTKKLYGSYDYPDVVVNGKGSATIKAKFGQVSGSLFNTLFFNGTASAGMMLLQLAEPQTVPAAPVNGAYTVTATYASGNGILANSVTDLAVRYAASGYPLTNSGAVAPAQGQYQFSNGNYTLSDADKGVQLILSYYYRTTTAASGTTFSRNQQLMGTTNFFSMFLSNSLNGVQSNMKFFRVKSSKLSRQTKNDDFTIPEMDFEAFNDPLGRVFEEYDAAP